MSGTIAKLPVMIVALVIGLILTFTAVMPLVSSYSDAKTFTNDGYYNVTYTETEEVTISWDHTKPKIITVDDTDIDLTGITVDLTIVAGDDWLVRYKSAGIVTFWPASGNTVEANVTAGTDMTIVASEGTATITTTAGSNNTASPTYTGLYTISENGDYVMKKSDAPAYLKGDSSILAIGITNINGGTAVILRFEGNIDDGLTESAYRVSGATFSNTTMDYSAVSGYKDLYSINKITSTVTYNTQNNNVTYSYFIVPAEVTADTNNPDVYKNLVSVLPLFALILLVAGAASLVYFKNKD